MWSELVEKGRLFSFFARLDEDLERLARDAGCPRCGGVLDRGHYVRKPRGALGALPAEYAVRRSLCCRSCRRRVLPRSCLFWDRRVYWGLVLMVVVMLRQRSERTMSWLRATFGVSSRTVRRWMEYFRTTFPATPWWQRLRGRVGPGVRDDALPAALLAVFEGLAEDVERAAGRTLAFLRTGETARIDRIIDGPTRSAKDG